MRTHSYDGKRATDTYRRIDDRRDKEREKKRDRLTDWEIKETKQFHSVCIYEHLLTPNCLIKIMCGLLLTKTEQMPCISTNRSCVFFSFCLSSSASSSFALCVISVIYLKYKIETHPSPVGTNTSTGLTSLNHRIFNILSLFC